MKSPERFWSRVDMRSPDECWLWRGGTNGRGELSYGVIAWDAEPHTPTHRPTRTTAHRVAYELTRGAVPDGLVVDHLCRERLCCNPAHLEAVTNRVNVLRGIGVTARAARRKCCPRGHAYTPRVLSSGKRIRVCVPCHAEDVRRSRMRRAA